MMMIGRMLLSLLMAIAITTVHATSNYTISNYLSVKGGNLNGLSGKAFATTPTSQGLFDFSFVACTSTNPLAVNAITILRVTGVDSNGVAISANKNACGVRCTKPADSNGCILGLTTGIDVSAFTTITSISLADTVGAVIGSYVADVVVVPVQEVRPSPIAPSAAAVIAYVAPTTEAPTTEAPTTAAPTTQTPTTTAPTGTTTQAPTTTAPTGTTTQAPTSNGTTTQAPTSGGTTTQAPTTQAPTSGGTTTQTPTTQAPTTAAPTTQAPTTQAPTTAAPTTAAPTTAAPTTAAPTTSAPSTVPAADLKIMFHDATGNAGIYVPGTNNGAAIQAGITVSGALSSGVYFAWPVISQNYAVGSNPSSIGAGASIDIYKSSTRGRVLRRWQPGGVASLDIGGFTLSNTAYTACAGIKYESLSVTQTIFGVQTSGTNPHNLQVLSNNFLQGSHGSTGPATSNVAIVTGSWTHTCVTYSAGSMILYQNGTQVGVSTTIGALSSPADAIELLGTGGSGTDSVGAGAAGTGLSGYIDVPKFWNQALTSSMIAQEFINARDTIATPINKPVTTTGIQAPATDPILRLTWTGSTSASLLNTGTGAYSLGGGTVIYTGSGAEPNHVTDTFAIDSSRKAGAYVWNRSSPNSTYGGHFYRLGVSGYTYTFSIWLKFNNVNTLDGTCPAGIPSTWAVCFYNSPTPRAVFSNSHVIIVDEDTFDPLVWNHFAWTYDIGTSTVPGSFNVYRNGELVTTKPAVYGSSNIDMYLGSTSTTGNGFDGSMYMPSFYDYVLTAGNVKYNYQNE
jgi:hypothetical protein